ncbi:MAG: hypothetical protein ABIO44_14125 [Saprospiraceae bacterium]
MKTIFVLLLTLSLNVFADDNIDYKFTTGYAYSDEFSDSIRIDHGYGLEEDNLRIDAGRFINNIHLDDKIKIKGGFLSITTSFNEFIKMKATLISADMDKDKKSQNFGSLQLFTKFNKTLSNELTCEKGYVDSFMAVQNDTNFIACYDTFEKKNGKFKESLTVGRYNFTDGNFRNYYSAKLGYQWNENIILQYIDKQSNNSQTSLDYFSPKNWHQQYLFVNAIDYKIYDKLSYNVGAGYGMETINSKSSSMYLGEVSLFYSSQRLDSYLKYTHKFGEYEYDYILVGIEYKF